MPDHTVLYWNRATRELYAVIRDETPPELQLLLLETDDPAEARAKLAQAEFILIADWALTAEHVEAAPRLRLVQHQGVGYERINTAALAGSSARRTSCAATCRSRRRPAT